MKLNDKLKLIKDKRNVYLTEYNELKRLRRQTPRLGYLKGEIERLDKRIKEMQFSALLISTGGKIYPQKNYQSYSDK